MYIKKESDGTYKSFNFVPPSGASDDKNEVLFPFHELQEPAFAATLAIAVKQMITIVKPGTLTGAATINLTVDGQLTRGAALHLELTADTANRVVSLGTGFDAAANDITVTAGETFYKTFVFDGTAFIPVNYEVLFPTSEVQTPDFAATLAIAVEKTITIVKPATLTGAVTINLTLSAKLRSGAKLHLKLTADGTGRVVTLGTGFDAAATDLTVTANTTFFRTYVFDGTAFIPDNQ